MIVNKITLKKLLDPYSENSLECDGMSKVVAYILDENNIDYKLYIGTLLNKNTNEKIYHQWIEVQNKYIIDYKSLMWFPDEDVWVGVFDKNKMNDKDLEYIPEKFGKIKVSPLVFNILVMQENKKMIKLKKLLLEDFASMDDAATFIGKSIDKSMPNFVQDINNVINDPKVAAVLKAGRTDGNTADEIVKYYPGNTPCSKLFPTQNEIGEKQSLSNILIDRYGQLDSILKGGISFPTPVIIYNNKYIIDGHHRWSQVYAANPNATINTLNFIGNLKPLDLLKIVQLAIAADINIIPTQDAKGENMLLANEQSITNIIIDGLNDKAISIFAQNGKGKTKQQIAKYLWKNISRMQQKNAPIPGAPIRDIMPQTDQSAKFMKYMKGGVINFVDPKGSDVKKENKMTKTQKLKRIIELIVRKQLTEVGDDYSTMSISDLAYVIRRDWRNVNFAARPYLEAMYSLDSINDKYGLDSGRSIVAYFLGNAQKWTGETAKAVKKELNKRLKSK